MDEQSVYDALRNKLSRWWVFLPVLLALVAQQVLEPPVQRTGLAFVLYALAAVALFTRARRGEISLAGGEPQPAAEEPARAAPIRIEGLLFGFLFAVLSFVLLRDNRFTLLNVTTWLFALACVIYACIDLSWLRSRVGAKARFSRLLRRGWIVRVTPWTVLVGLVLLLTVFFRFYRFDALPIDMVSDHAEKLLDVYDVLHGKSYIFFERNTGREPFQFYWTALWIKLLGLDVSFFSLKLGTAFAGLIAVYYTYRLGRLVGGRWVGLLALLFVGVAYWPNIISRIALRFPLYPMFVAPLLFHLIRGMRTRARNDFLWAGIWLGIGLNGYTSSRIVPFLVLLAFALYLLSNRSRGARQEAVLHLLLIVALSFLLFLPVLRYGVDHPEMVVYRALTRIGEAERDIPGSPLGIFAGNFWSALTMFFYNNGSIWVHSVPFRPALDVVMAAFFFVGLVLLAGRYARERNWEDLFLLFSVPVLLLSTALSLAFPDENPSLNRASGAYVPVLVIAALGLEAVLRALRERWTGRAGQTAALLAALALIGWTTVNNYDLFFRQYDQVYRQSAWNTREIGAVVRGFARLNNNSYENYYVIGYPYWIDSRQVAIFAGHIERDPGIMPEALPSTLDTPGLKLFILNPQDIPSLDVLRQMYPLGWSEYISSETPGKDFVLYLTLPQVQP